MTTNETNETTASTEDQLRRASHLGRLLTKYAHRWTDSPSRRMMKWADEYNGIKLHLLNNGHDCEWTQWCNAEGFSSSHDAYDCLA